LLLVVLGDLEDGGHVVAKVEFLERCFDVLACNRLLRVLFGNLVGFGRDEGDELDAAFNQEIARVFGKSHAGLAGQDILDNLLYSRWGALAVVRVWGGARHKVGRGRKRTLWQRQVIVAAKLAVGHGGGGCGMRGAVLALGVPWVIARSSKLRNTIMHPRTARLFGRRRQSALVRFTPWLPTLDCVRLCNECTTARR